MNRLINHRRMPISFHLTSLVILIYTIITGIYFILAMYNTNKDLSRFVVEIEMLQFEKSFMTPFDLFLGIRLGIGQYINGYYAGAIDKAEIDPLIDWLYGKVDDAYQDMRDDFAIQFDNPYIQEFFVDEYFVSYFMNQSWTNLEEKNLTFRESLYALLHYQYMFKVAYYDDRP